MELAKVGLSINDVELREIATADTIAVFSDPSIAAVGTYVRRGDQDATGAAIRMRERRRWRTEGRA